MPEDPATSGEKETLSDSLASVLKEEKWARSLRTRGLEVFVDGGEEQNSFWFEIWQFRYRKPPRKVYSSPSGFFDAFSAELAGIGFVKSINPKCKSG